MVTDFNYPHHFRDVMTCGAFHGFANGHRLKTQPGGTVMIDEVVFQSLPSLPGRLVDALFMTRYLRRLLEGRCEAIKHEAEASARR